MTLTIIIDFDGSGLDMELNLNKAIDELAAVLKKKGLCEMELTGLDDKLKELYKITIK